MIINWASSGRSKRVRQIASKPLSWASLLQGVFENSLEPSEIYQIGSNFHRFTIHVAVANGYYKCGWAHSVFDRRTYATHR